MHTQPHRRARVVVLCWKLPLALYIVWANSKGSGETAQILRLFWAFPGCLYDEYHFHISQLLYHISSSLNKVIIIIIIILVWLMYDMMMHHNTWLYVQWSTCILGASTSIQPANPWYKVWNANLIEAKTIPNLVTLSCWEAIFCSWFMGPSTWHFKSSAQA